VPKRIKPDLVHTFHIGFGADLAASIVVWLAKLGKFGASNFDERLRTAYGMFQEFCHAEKRYTSCEEWCIKKFGMSSSLGVYICSKNTGIVGFTYVYIYAYMFYSVNSCLAEDKRLSNERGWEGARHSSGVQVVGSTFKGLGYCMIIQCTFLLNHKKPIKIMKNYG